ncbi:hypothetical protein BCR44DRAFT_1273270 [Catenaria anguillulae PL171]|uniref:Uncharacterized protein n=1 Tax=Catenaria anguillulae PL171 TaxID=765915 RepID=A0A1Y2H9U2_9FUNG|nr:hypothetical protein BCR44DRAFT_1273270 [Catenaria anguillulae PL171]
MLPKGKLACIELGSSIVLGSMGKHGAWSIIMTSQVSREEQVSRQSASRVGVASRRWEQNWSGRVGVLAWWYCIAWEVCMCAMQKARINDKVMPVGRRRRWSTGGGQAALYTCGRDAEQASKRAVFSFSDWRENAAFLPCHRKDAQREVWRSTPSRLVHMHIYTLHCSHSAE